MNMSIHVKYIYIYTYIYVTGELTFLVFFGILVRPGTDLGQDFSDLNGKK